MKPKIDRTWDPGELNDYLFFGKSWGYYNKETKIERDTLAGFDAWLSDDDATLEDPRSYKSTTTPLDDVDDFTRESIKALQGWGRGPVSVAMSELDITDINDQESFDEVINWLSDNYGDLSGPKPFDKESVELTPYEPRELEIPDFNPPAELELQPSSMTIGAAPEKTNQLQITGFKR